MKFRNDIDNEEEDTLSDDDLIQEIKQSKCNEMNKRADLVTEQTAISQIIKGCQRASAKVNN